MKVVRVRNPGGPEALEYGDIEKPTPMPGQILVRTRACGVGRADTLIRRGVYHQMPPLPANPGNELAGEVEAVGAGTQHFSLGDKVFIGARDLSRRGGCYTEFICVSEDVAYQLPSHVNLEEAACLANYQVAWMVLHEAIGPRTPRTVLIIGAAGGIGSALVQLAKAAGMTVIGTVSTAEKSDFAKRIGVDHVINYRNEDVIERTRSITSQHGVDAVFDHAAGSDFPRYPSILADWGWLVSYNAYTPLPEKDILSSFRENVDRCPALRCFSSHVFDARRDDRRRITTNLIKLLANGKIKPAIGVRLPMREARKAHTLLEAGQSLGKILLLPDDVR
jgi:NADPH2:quinone reductase